MPASSTALIVIISLHVQTHLLLLAYSNNYPHSYNPLCACGVSDSIAVVVKLVVHMYTHTHTHTPTHTHTHTHPHTHTHTHTHTQAIKRDCPNECDDCFTKLLEQWLTGSTPAPTLGALIHALKSRVISRGDIAQQMESKLTKLASQ